MIRRQFQVRERGQWQHGRSSYLTEPGPWIVEAEHPTDPSASVTTAAGLSYLAAQVWAETLEQTVDHFIEDNQQTCASCKARWMILDELPALFCPRCNSQQNVKQYDFPKPPPT